jgi:hypothetical protein
MDGSIGEFIQAGIEKSEGKFISLLEDDDEFESYKLDHIKEVLNYTDFDYYKDSMSIIDENDNSIQRNVKNLQREKMNLEFIDSSYYNSNKKLKTTFQMRGVPSTLTFKKVKIMDMLENLCNIESEIGHYFYYRFVDRNLKLLLDNAILTRYRISSISDSSAMSPSDYIKVRRKYAERTLKTYELLIPEIKNQKILTIIQYEESSFVTESYFLNYKKPSFHIFLKNVKFYLLSKKLIVSSVYILFDLLSYLIYPKFYYKGRYLIESRWKN